MDFVEKMSETSEEVVRRREKTETERVEREKKIRKFKKHLLEFVIPASLAITAVVAYKAGQNNPVVDEKTAVTREVTCNESTASPEVLNAWADYAYSKFSDDAQKANMPNYMYESYYMPVKDAYNNYSETQDERYKEVLKQQVRIFENELNDSNIGDYSFNNSPFIYSIVKDGKVLTPYIKEVNDGVLPDNVISVGNQLYEISSSDEDSNSLSM